MSTHRSPVSYTHLRAHETPEHLVCRLLLEKKNNNKKNIKTLPLIIIMMIIIITNKYSVWPIIIQKLLDSFELFTKATFFKH